jgi:hypothetical protein
MSTELDFLKDLTNEEIQAEIDRNKKIIEDGTEESTELAENIVTVWQAELDSRS